MDFPYTAFQKVIPPSEYPVMIYALFADHVIALTLSLPFRVAFIFAYFYLPGLSRSKTLI